MPQQTTSKAVPKRLKALSTTMDGKPMPKMSLMTSQSRLREKILALNDALPLPK